MADDRAPGPGDVAADAPSDEPGTADGGVYEGPEYEPAKPADQEDPEDPEDPDDEGWVGVSDDVPACFADCDEA